MRMLNMIVLTLSLFFSQAVFAEEAQVAEAQTDTIESSVSRGQMIFDAVCIHCHHKTTEIGPTGCPGLKNVLTRHGEEWLNKWILAPEEFSKVDIKAKDVVDANPYQLVMPALPEMQDEQKRKDMIEFLKTLK